MVIDRPHNANDKKECTCTASPYLSTEEAAERLKLSSHTLNKWRSEGQGPAFRDHGRRIVYHIDDLDTWSQDQKRQKSRTYKRCEDE